MGVFASKGPRSRPAAGGGNRSPSQAMVYFVLCSATLFSLVYTWGIHRATHQAQLTFFVVGLLAFKTLVEVGASYYGFTFVFIALAYLFKRERANEFKLVEQLPPVGLIYLCCNDLDRAALFSLASIAYHGKLYLMVHDDSVSAEQRRDVDQAVQELRRRTDHEVLLLRRPNKEGGKAGVTNYVLAQTAHLYDYFLLCDNDSTALDPRAIERALLYFEDPKIAIVQCRNVGVVDSDTCYVNGLLSRSIDAFNVFLTATCDVPEHKLQLGLLKIGLATFERRQAVQAQMRPLMIVVLQKFVQDPHAGLGRARPMNRKTFLVQSPKESFDLSVRFWVPRSRPPVFDAQAPAGLLEAGLPLRMKRITHGEDEVVVGHHRFDPIRQFGYEPLQKRRCIV